MKILDADERERFFIPASVRITVGRGPENDIRINNPRVSVRHCTLVSDDTKVFLEDLASVHGVVVNDQRVQGRRLQLTDGDVITVGDARLQYWSLVP